MVNEIMKVDIRGIKCDARNCDYNNDDVVFEEYSEWVGRPCPLCGANLLTQEAHDHAKAFIALSKKINKWFGWMFPKVKKYDATITPLYDERGMPNGHEIRRIEDDRR